MPGPASGGSILTEPGTTAGAVKSKTSVPTAGSATFPARSTSVAATGTGPSGSSPAGRYPKTKESPSPPSIDNGRPATRSSGAIARASETEKATSKVVSTPPTEGVTRASPSMAGGSASP